MAEYWVSLLLRNKNLFIQKIPEPCKAALGVTPKCRQETFFFPHSVHCPAIDLGLLSYCLAGAVTVTQQSMHCSCDRLLPKEVPADVHSSHEYRITHGNFLTSQLLPNNYIHPFQQYFKTETFHRRQEGHQCLSKAAVQWAHWGLIPLR